LRFAPAIIQEIEAPAVAKERRAEVTYSVNLNAPADGKPLNEDLYGFNLGYKITFREL
jgi:hypothetical protein